ncbi:M48 family metallopeptidase [Paucibacter sp. PLA-PC-4]|uniref:M48 family metallopeptidase n=1 Tax=Paucibacter sp. PLA-PC-4 TaxID=2993655 RepID=UPI0022497CC6|nr:M48 family metallopeptidase [Paucibacter sp. PLA-PC-4]MCX2863207.1 M48 family metallopeptidase [Paucibacter sp. PLA-PC-4]
MSAIPSLSPISPVALSLAFAAALLLSLALKLWLSTRQVRHVMRHRNEVPTPFAATVPLAAHQKAADYTVARSRFGLLAMAFNAAVLLGWTLLGGLDALNLRVYEWVAPHWGSMAYQLALLLAFGVIGALLDLPFELYNTFRIEQRFGFNRMTWRLYVADAAKSALVGALIGLPIAALILWLMGAAGELWWLWAWGAWMGFNLLILVLYPTVIAPLFNKFEPLADEGLRSRVEGLMQRCGFAAKGLFVMDGSRRSAHGNAYFTGIGAAKRVVFFDTLLQRLSGPEVEAVLAHELGHFKHKHVLKRMVLMFALSLAGFALLGWLSRQVGFYLAFGVQPNLAGPNDALALLLFMLVLPVFGFFFTPLASRLSRKDEFQADAYACAQASGADLAAALLKLHEDNAGTLTPDPIYARFYYSHPPASERLAALQTT